MLEILYQISFALSFQQQQQQKQQLHFFQLYYNEAEKLETVLRPQLNLLGQDSFQSTSVPHILPDILKHQQHQVKQS